MTESQFEGRPHEALRVQQGAAQRDTWITGVGILSCLGEGADAHLEALDEGKAHDRCHPLCALHRAPAGAKVNFDAQIPKKGDQRQMEPWQRIGTYAAGLALDSAGVKGNTEHTGPHGHDRGRGWRRARSQTVDGAILSGLPKAENSGRFLNERLMNDLRPTLFLAQLSNLLAGNISIVHGVTGSSRTFMGEESAGVDAVRIAQSRIAAGQSDIAIAGGAQNAERKEMLMLYEFGGFNLKEAFAPIWERRPVRAWHSAPWARSWCWKMQRMRRHAAYGRWRGSPPS